MARNQITSSVPISIFNISSLQYLLLAKNNLKGSLPREIGNLTKMQFLYLNENRFTGEIPKDISNLVELEVLSLEYNSFSGSLEMEIFNISGLKKISLTQNNLSGTLPPNIFFYLRILINLIGTIPHSISNCSKLTILELSNNTLTGLIPNSLGYLTQLQKINLQLNNLTSDSSLSFLISLTNCRALRLLGIAFNPLNGMLPVSVRNLSTSLTLFYALNCKIKGRIPNEVGNLSSLLELDLSGNNLVGSIPTSTCNLRNLQRLRLTNNELTGFIGNNLCKLQRLGAIYLGENQLSGPLPSCLGNVTSLGEIHLGFNKFSSNIPESLGNLKNLLALNLSSNNMGGSLPPEIENLKAFDTNGFFNESISNGIPREIGGLQKSGVPFFETEQQAHPLSISTRGRISYYELLQATDGLSESNLIGSGSFGSVYKGVLRSGTPIAVKVFNLQLDMAFKSFDTECEVLCNLRHRNLVKVITSCSNLDFKALVLEYMPNGSLEKCLYSHNYFLDIMQRLSIMIDVACALEYLHHGCSSPVVHCDLKPSTFLVDEHMVAHLSNFGISKLLGEDESDLYTKTLATLGYIAPDVRFGIDPKIEQKKGLVEDLCLADHIDQVQRGFIALEESKAGRSMTKYIKLTTWLGKWGTIYLGENASGSFDVSGNFNGPEYLYKCRPLLTTLVTSTFLYQSDAMRRAWCDDLNMLMS
ncbi:hypothetical protein RND71_030796 [Anisodus tanguticus]|uniref:Protein kinase domain-containing protein n=1 Tax=Anisodus tanguticus TaxID=243964 RepID=A0AAE1RI87_9SOLA|nr:hypothetical protein RND71_030796 [Anisodus tanguticus]